MNKRGSPFKKLSKTVLLDVKTIDLLKEYARENLGSESMSAAIRAMAREYEHRRKSIRSGADDK